jgi:hypothetical protein
MNVFRGSERTPLEDRGAGSVQTGGKPDATPSHERMPDKKLQPAPPPMPEAGRNGKRANRPTLAPLQLTGSEKTIALDLRWAAGFVLDLNKGRSKSDRLVMGILWRHLDHDTILSGVKPAAKGLAKPFCNLVVGSVAAVHVVKMIDKFKVGNVIIDHNLPSCDLKNFTNLPHLRSKSAGIGL